MLTITEEEENKLLDNDFFICNRNGKDFTIQRNKIICFGNINFTTNSDDYCTMQNMNLLDYLDFKGITIPSNYNYEDNSCITTTQKINYTETWNFANLAQYIHGRLGKPERVCIFTKISNIKSK